MNPYPLSGANHKDVVKYQFNKQGEIFSLWKGTQDEIALSQLFKFIDFSKSDKLLDIACGSGEFAIFCAHRIKNVYGVDFSYKMIELAKSQAASHYLNNVFFECHDVNHIRFANENFDVVSCRAAFHHMEDYEQILNEMIRCVNTGGLICVADLITYSNPRVTAFFDTLDKAIDVSHNARISQNTFSNLFKKSGLKIIKSSILELETDLHFYISHAIQSKEAIIEINELLTLGLNDPEISQYLYKKDENVVFKNKAVRILGQKI